MAERTVKVNLVADVSDYTAGLVAAANATRGLGDNVDREMKRTETNARTSGERTGSTLAKGINQGLIRNSPLIVAGVASALAAGAPAVLVGATAMFGGIGAVAAAQTLQVRAAWSDLGKSIRDGAVQDAAVLVPVFTQMAQQIGATFQQLQPEIRAAFTAAAPLIDSFTHSLANAAEIIMPALTRAVQSAGPVMDGLGHVIEQIAVGLAQMFDTLSAHSGAAGTALAAIGDILSALLPILGELLGAGAEIAAVVLPPLASALHVVADALGAIAPVLPGVVAGFLAFKAITALSGPIESVAGGIGKLVGGFKSLSGAPVAAASGLASFTGALGPIGIGVGLAIAQFALWQQQLNTWGEALAQGGQKAALAAQQIRDVEKFAAVAGSGIQGFIGNLTGYGFALDSAAHASENAAKAQKAYEESLNPVEAAQLRVTKAQDALARALESGDPTRVAAAQRDYASASEEAARQQGLLEQAIHGVTQAMIDQGNTALAAIDSQFAMQQAQINTQRAIEDLAATQADSKASALDLAQSQLDVATSLKAQADATAQAKADYSGLTEGTAEYTRFIQTETLTALQNLKAQFPQFGPVIDGMIAQLVAGGVAVTDLGNQTATPTVDLNQAPFQVGLDVAYNLLGALGVQRPTPTADLNTGPLAINWGTAMSNIAILNGQTPTPTASMNAASFSATWSAAMSNVATLAAQTPTPTASLIDNASRPLSGIIGLLGRVVSKTVTVTVMQSVHNLTAGLAGATGGEIGGLKKHKRSSGGRVVGPGTGTSDDVPFMAAQGLTWLANREFVVRESSARKYGDRAMKAINAGTATVFTGREVSASRGGSGGAGGLQVNIRGARIVGTLEVDGLPARIEGQIVEAVTEIGRELVSAGVRS